MKKLVSLILSIFTLCSMNACTIFPSIGGGNNGNNQQSSNSSAGDNTEYTDYKLVDNGTSQYKLVLKDEATFNEENGVWEIEELFKEATSITLETVYESEVTYSANAKLIILGNTEFTNESGVNVKKIPHDGFTLKTVDSNVFILGEDAGVLYGAYEFLTQTLGYEYYLNNVYSLNKGVKNLYMPDFDYSDAPDFATRTDGWGLGDMRTRTEGIHDPFIHPGNPLHNTFDWLPKEDYLAGHAGWYSTYGDQLCYTARGNASELATMREIVLEKFKAQVEYYFEQGYYDNNVISFTQQDNSHWCNCAACLSVINAKGGANAATVIQFLNPIAQDLQEWVDARYPGRKVSVIFFAYNATEQAPSNMVMADNLYVWMALPSADYLRSINDPVNSVHKQKLSAWAELSKKLYVWSYDTNFAEYMLWYDTFGTLQDFYQYVKSLGAEYVFNQGQLYSGSNYTGFDALKAALNYKLMWDVDMDVEAFTQRFFDAWFNVAAEPMKAYYDSFRAWSAGLIQNGYSAGFFGGSRLYNRDTASEWPADKLEEWMGYIEDAYESIADLETTKPNRYKNLCKRINAESIAVRYAQIKLHGGSTNMKLEFKEDATSLRFTRKSEMEGIDVVWRAWGV
ncbi:MAG: DUF4838 domain-containing protein [Clostridiales bacterium]|nr:DUF4838 domain-containing protein [Clostridiales bacterium]